MLRAGEQPYFQAYRIARRIVGDDWQTWDFMAWIQGQWADFGLERGETDRCRLGLFPNEFRAWLFARVGHPEAA